MATLLLKVPKGSHQKSSPADERENERERDVIHKRRNGGGRCGTEQRSRCVMFAL